MIWLDCCKCFYIKMILSILILPVDICSGPSSIITALPPMSCCMISVRRTPSMYESEWVTIVCAPPPAANIRISTLTMWSIFPSIMGFVKVWVCISGCDCNN